METNLSFSKVGTPTSLSFENLKKLIDKKVLFLRYPNFVNEQICNKWAACFNQTKSLSRYSNAPDVSVNRIGMTLFETENNPDKLLAYFKQGQKTFSTIEQLLDGENPVKMIHDYLGKIWDQGCRQEKMKGKYMNPGIIRSFEADPLGGLPPHVDTLCKDIPDVQSFEKMKCQLASNLYISISDYGGELELWDYAPDQEELKTMFNGTHDFIDVNKIPVPSIKIRPKVGELIIFRSECIHSVRPSTGGLRTTASSFIGYYSDDTPLTVWA